MTLNHTGGYRGAMHHRVEAVNDLSVLFMNKECNKKAIKNAVKKTIWCATTIQEEHVEVMNLHHIVKAVSFVETLRATSLRG